MGRRVAGQPSGEEGDTADEMDCEDSDEGEPDEDEESDGDEDLEVCSPPDTAKAHGLEWTRMHEHVRQDKFTAPKRAGSF